MKDEPRAASEPVTAALIHSALHKKVMFIKSRTGKSVAEILTAFAGPGIDQEMRRLLDEMNAELRPGG